MSNGRLVVDASIVAKTYLRDEAFTELADAVLDEQATGNLEIIAPRFILYEIPSALQKAAKQQRISETGAFEAVSNFFELGIVTVGDESEVPDIIKSAFVLGQQLGCHLFDALYLAVAEGLGVPFLTADRRLYDRAAATQDVIWIEDYEPAS